MKTPIVATPIQDVQLLDYVVAHETINESQNYLAGTEDIYTGLFDEDPYTSQEQRQRDQYELDNENWNEVIFEEVLGSSTAKMALHSDWIAQKRYDVHKVVHLELPEQGISGSFLITSIKDLTPDATTTTNYFLDNDQLKREEYQFRMVAKDESGNISGSQIITVRPYDSGLRGEIQNFFYEIVLLEDPDVEGDIGTVLLAAIDDYQTDRVIDYDKIQLLSAAGWIPDRVYGAIVGGQDPERTYQSLLEIKQTRLGYLYGYIPELHFSWIYEYEEDPVDFQIFRSAEGGPIMLYTTLPREEVLADRYHYKFEDKDVKAGVRYFYQIMARHSGEGFSLRSETVMIFVR